MYHLFKEILLCGFAISVQTEVTAQECGTNPTPAQIEYLSQTREARQAFDITQLAEDRSGTFIHWIPVRFQECLPTSNSPKILREINISKWLGELNNLFFLIAFNFTSVVP